jgi:protein KTI12
MALILITGRPCTGKSLVVARIADELRVPPHTRHVHVVNDAASTTFTRAHTYDDSHTERAHRAYLRSLVQQHVSKNTIVIVDALNYIKGYRYELFCAGKLAQCMYCVVTVDAPDELADQLNDSRPECSRCARTRLRRDCV